MSKREVIFHKWFGAAMPEMQKETTNLVNHLCVSTTSAFFAGWDACARQNEESPVAASNSRYQSALDVIMEFSCVTNSVAFEDDLIEYCKSRLHSTKAPNVS